MSIKDFQAKRIRTNRIIGNGSPTGRVGRVDGTPHTSIYSASIATDYEGDVVGGGGVGTTFWEVGTDVGLFVSGAVGSRNAWQTPGISGKKKKSNRGGTTLIGGDLHVSGAITATSIAGAGAATGSFNEPKVGGFFVTTASVALAGTKGFLYAADSIGTDTYFFVSGSRTPSGSDYRAAATNPAVSVFGGDLVVSGTLYAERQVIEVDKRTDGDFLVSGSAQISGSLNIRGRTDDPTITKDYRIRQTLKFDSGFANAIVWDSFATNDPDAFIYERTADAIDTLHLSASDNIHLDGKYFHLTGAANTTLKTTNGNLTLSSSNITYIKGGEDIEIVAKDKVLIREDLDNAGTFFRISSQPTVGVYKTLLGISDQAVVFNQEFEDIDWRVESVGKPGIMLSDGGTNQVALGTEGTTAADAYARPAVKTLALPGDISVYLSGTVGGHNVDNVSTIVAAGDTVVSGTLYTNTIQASKTSNLDLKSIGDNGDITFTVDDGGTDFVALTIDGGDLGYAYFTPRDGGGLKVDDAGDDGNTLVKGDGGVSVRRYVDSATNAADFTITKTRGSAGAETSVQDNDNLGKFQWVAQDATGPRYAIQLRGAADGTPGDGDMPARLEIKTITAGSSSPTMKMVVKNDGKIGIGTPYPSGSLDVSGDGVTTQVLLMSGSGAKVHADESTYADMALFVSGAIKSKDTNRKGVSVFGGDVVISGSLQVGAGQLGLSGSLTQLTDGTSYLIAGSGINIVSESNGSVTITGTATSAEWTDEGTVLRPNDGVADQVGIGSTGLLKSTYPIFFGPRTAGAPMSVETSGYVTASLGLSGSLTRLSDGTSYLIAGSGISVDSGSNGNSAITISTTAAAGQWTDEGNILRSSDGAGDSVGVGGTGNLRSEYPIFIGEGASGYMVGVKGFVTASMGLSGSLTRLTDGTSYLRSGTGINIVSASNGAITISTSAGGGTVTSGSFNVPAPSKFVTTASVSMAGGLGFAHAANVGRADTFFFVSGSVGSKGTSTAGTTLFGGDTVISGTLHTDCISGSYVEATKVFASGSDLMLYSWNDTLFRIDRDESLGPGETAFWRFRKGNNVEIATLDTEGKWTFVGGAELLDAGGKLFDCGINAQFTKNVTLGNASTDDITFTGRAASHLLPKSDSTYDLGSADRRWANIYTGDLHLRNDKGNWTIQEDSDKLIVINNLTGKKYKMMLAPLEDDE